MSAINTNNPTANNIFTTKVVKDEGANYEIHFLGLHSFTTEFLDYMSEHLVAICEGIGSESPLNIVKKRMVKFFEKKDENTTMGAIAEFIMHLYLKNLGYKQECTYFNLEEGSIKKGFDGYYTKEKIEWILESKSGYVDHSSVTHPLKIKKAYDDLVEKFSGKVTNNPWQNAYKHASLLDVIPDQDVRKKLRKLADDFTEDKFPLIDEYYLIPASTIFLNGVWNEPDYPDIEKTLAENIKKYKYREMIVICLTKKSIDLFLNYIKS
ncbi:hypothetical protein [Paenibacillus lautus]|uniref:hypothetical protein n=1 Tax=Paenibacillus lautus TaxID=1401 RepID=UPI0020D0E7D0|nr:hypothetical protein [Paenibacillus lautus]